VKRESAVILHNQVGPGSPKDELDVLVQAESIGRSLAELRFRVSVVPFSLHVARALAALRRAAPLFVFNLVESVAGDGRLIHLAPALLDHLGLPYTGCGQEAMFTTSNKVLAKRILRQAGLPTPEWLEAAPSAEGRVEALPPGTYLLKSVWEHASNWFAGDSVVQADGVSGLRQALARKNGGGRGFFAERYVEGREFNLSLLAGACLPPAEMRFLDYPQGQLRVVDFRAKWEEDSFEYAHTRRGFDFAAADAPLLDELRRLARRCWRAFDLSGYARVDFRVDAQGRPWVLEINANPCLAPDGGFVAAAAQAGLTYTQMVERIAADCLSRRAAAPAAPGGEHEGT